MGLVTLIFNLETGMRVASKVGNLFFPNLDTLGLLVLELRDGQTDGQKQRLLQ